MLGEPALVWVELPGDSTGLGQDSCLLMLLTARRGSGRGFWLVMSTWAEHGTVPQPPHLVKPR